MDRHLEEIVRILTEEKGVFQKILSLEEAKTGSIVSQDGKLLEKLSREQEDVLTRVSALESERMSRIMNFMKTRPHGGGTVSLRDVAASAGPDGGRLLSIGKDLNGMLSRLELLRNTNKKLISDNMEYFNILLSGLRRGYLAETGYGADGREEEKAAQAILFNKTA